MNRTPQDPKPGDVLVIDGQASVQFSINELVFRVIRVDPRPTYDGWLWLHGYSLKPTGEAIEKREIFVQRAGLRTAALRPGRR
ncbi:hypothetical protein ABZU53_11180 [Micromonospora sp. NPDC005194]|uniref:hypothetical protein n=1 Tax=Micromonospora sp. NPDC005194 TaxID=3156870 RepID=UPI0033AC3AFD